MAYDDESLARLLAGRDEPSVLAKERILDAVLDEVSPKPWLVRHAAASALAAAAAVVLVVSAPRLLDPPPEAETFVVRGADAGALQVHCLDAPAGGRCPTGGRIALEVTPPEGWPYVAAFVVQPDGTVAWITPQPGDVTRRFEGGMWPNGTTLGENPGEYRVVVVFSEQHADRARIRAGFDEGLRAVDPSLRTSEAHITLEGAP